MTGPVATGSMAASRREAVERASRRARWAIVAVAVSATSGVLTTFAFQQLMTGVQRTRGGTDAALRFAAFSGVGSLVSLTAVVLFLMWLHRAVANVALLDATTSVQPGEAVVAYFIPILNFFRPYQAMKEIYRASDPTPLGDVPVFRDRIDPDYRGGAREAMAPAPWAFRAPILGWWLLYATRGVANLVAIPASSMLGRPGILGGQFLSAAWEVAAAVACVLVIRSVDARQRERCRRLEAMHREQ
jgi:hypothetical protein